IITLTEPYLLKQKDQIRIAESNKAAVDTIRKFREYTMNDIVTWSVISIPTRAWVQKIYPEKTADEAVSALWDTIYKMVRVDGEDPIEVWNKHNQRLENAFITLNDKQYTKLHLKAQVTY